MNLSKPGVLLTPLYVLLFLAGCNALDEIAAPNFEEEFIALVEQLDVPGELLISSSQERFVEEFEPATAGMTASGLRWAVLSPNETRTLFLGMAFGQAAERGSGRKDRAAFSVQAVVDCTLESGAGLRTRQRFANCVANLHEQCDGAWTWTDDNGDIHAEGKNMSTNENGELILSDCEFCDLDYPDDPDCEDQ
ncbi:MAG: hypothetical protein OXI38_04635 [Bacteroidota bacterium]|nr:hypothetical protein [Bacteroidota bacterium]